MMVGCLLWMAVFGISAAAVWFFGWIAGIIAFAASFTAAALFAGRGGRGDDDGDYSEHVEYFDDYE